MLLELALLHFWPTVLQGRGKGRDSSPVEESNSPGMLFPLDVPDLVALCEGSSGMAAFSVSLSLADGTVACFSRPAMFSEFISAEVVVTCMNKKIMGGYQITNVLSKQAPA